MATPPKDPTDTPTATPKPPAPRKPATPRKAAAPRKTARKTAATSAPVAKPAARKPSAPRTATAAAAASKPATARKPAARRSPAKAKPAAGTSKWGLAAVIGGVGAALTAGLLALRGSTPTPTAADDVAKPNAGQTAHQADGSDSSASFEAGIADEGTIPE